MFCFHADVRVMLQHPVGHVARDVYDRPLCRFPALSKIRDKRVAVIVPAFDTAGVLHLGPDGAKGSDVTGGISKLGLAEWKNVEQGMGRAERLQEPLGVFDHPQTTLQHTSRWCPRAFPQRSARPSSGEYLKPGILSGRR